MLFNSAVFGTRMFNGGTVIAEMFSTDTAVFEGFSLSDGTRMVLTEYPTRFGPTREIAGDVVPRGDGRFQTSEFFRENTIELEGYVKHTSKELLGAYLDTIKKTLRSPGDLDLIDEAGAVKRYRVTADNFDEMFSRRRRYHNTICPFVIRFRCLTPFGKSRAYSSTSLAVSSSPTTQAVVNSGTYTAQPVVTLNFTAASSVTVVLLENVTTGESITYAGSISASDVLVFDSEQKQVTKNGTAVDFTGAFPSLDVGANLLRVTVTGTSFAAYLTAKHKSSYL